MTPNFCILIAKNVGLRAFRPVQQTNKNRREIFRIMEGAQRKMSEIEKASRLKLSRLLRRRHLRRRRYPLEYPSAVGKLI